jgi:hypothetical protein
VFGAADSVFSAPPDVKTKWELRKLYYRQRNYGARHGRYTTDFADLRGADKWSIQPQIYATPNLFEISARTDGGMICIRQDGYVWRE